MYGITDLKVGVTFVFDKDPYVVLESQHSKQGRSGAVLRTKIKNLLNGSIIERTFRGGDKFEQVMIERSDSQYLYKEGDVYYFMDQKNFDQISLDKKIVGDAGKFLIEGNVVQLHFYKEKAINIELPIKMEFLVTEAEKGLRGDTATSANKQVKIETGIMVSVPIFVNKGDKIRIDTRNGAYLERAK